jgi:zinc D-Ala-D-Ala dipeptidase
MKNNHRILITYLISCLLVSLFTPLSANAAINIKPANEQLIVVTSPTWDSSSGKLQRYQRSDAQHAWQVVGKPIAVMLGKKGMAQIKKEGDLRAPAGIFALGTSFGFAKKTNALFKLPYLPITNTTVCVDDLKSPYYNHIINSNQVTKNSWQSGEQMITKSPQYTWGVAVDYNTSTPVPGAGSCIFMHVWASPTTPTVGCIAMSKEHIQQILAWLDPGKQPLIALYPMSIYNGLQNTAHLPRLS